MKSNVTNGVGPCHVACMAILLCRLGQKLATFTHRAIVALVVVDDAMMAWLVRYVSFLWRLLLMNSLGLNSEGILNLRKILFSLDVNWR